MVQDGGVEGCALTPSYKNIRITTDCWTIIERKTLELTKKDTPHLKTKEKPQWDGRRGAITIKSNPLTAGWVLANWRTFIPQKSTHWREGSEPHVRLPDLGVQQQEEKFLENQTLKASGIWWQDFDRTGGNRDSTLGGHTQSSVLIGTQGKEQWHHRRLNQTYLLLLEGLMERWGVAVCHRGDKDTGSRSSEKYSLAWALPESAISPTKEPGSLECWVASGQTTNREGTQPH